jgi:hypothetical protein
MSRHDRIARIVRRAIQRCAGELNASPPPDSGGGGGGGGSRRERP